MSDWDGWYNGTDWDAMNERLKATSQDESSYHWSDPKPVRSRLAGRISYEFKKIMAEKKPTTRTAQKCLPRDIQVIDASRVYVTTETPNDTMAERLQMRINGNYVTIVRYNGDSDNCLVDVNGQAQSASMETIDAILEDL